jgi:toxin CcdB
MTQFAVYKNKNPATRKLYPYLFELQADLLAGLRTTVVAPVCTKQDYPGQRLKELSPELEIDGRPHLVLIHQLAGIDRAVLGAEVCRLPERRAEWIAAMDFLLSGV